MAARYISDHMVERITGDEVRAIRDKLGLSGQMFGARLAEMLGQERAYTPSEVSHWETGRRDLPPLLELALIREGLYKVGSAPAKKRKGRA